LFLAVKVTLAPPRHGMCKGPAMLRQAGRRLHLDIVLLDAGYDAEKTHVLVQEVLGAESIIPARTGRGTSRPPTGKYRRMMHDAFPKEQYGQRWQVESAISRDRRLFGSAVRATSWPGQRREGYLRILVHNLLILLLAFQTLFNRAGMTQLRVGLTK